MSFVLTINIDLDEVDGFSDSVSEGILIADSIREVSVRVKLFHVVGNVPGNRGGVYPIVG